jgi:ABC-2 type transport system permease protein
MSSTAEVLVAPVPDPGVRTVLLPKWRTALARAREERSGTPVKLLLLALVAAGFWSAVFTVAYRVLLYARSAPEIGSFLPQKMLGVILLAFASILLLSNLVTALSTFFLAKDLDMLIAAPIDWLRLYLAKLGETVAHSSWMVALLAIPIFTAYGIVYDGGPWFWLVALGAFVPFLLLPGVIGAVITLVLVNVFPARRTRDLLSLVAIGAMAIVVVTLRVLQPERLARPEGFRNLVDFLGALQSPTSPFLPTEWTADIIMNWLNRVADPLPIVLLWSTAGVFVVLGALAHKRLYRNGFTKAQEGAEQYVRGKHWPRFASRVLRGLPVAKREFIVKDVLLFFRDTTQWSQLILLAVLLLVYIFNIRALPLFTGERVSVLLVTMVVFLNLALAGFVLAAIAARFVFPSVSLEGKQLWLLCSSPLDLEALMWSKYWTGTIPLLVLALIITGVTNVLLQASPFMMAVSIGTITLYTLATSALALCFGTLFPQFDTENAAQIPTSFGGLVYMMASVCLLGVVIALEARPVLQFVRANQAGMPLEMDLSMGLMFAASAVLCLASTLIALRIGLKRIREIDA